MCVYVCAYVCLACARDDRKVGAGGEGENLQLTEVTMLNRSTTEDEYLASAVTGSNWSQRETDISPHTHMHTNAQVRTNTQARQGKHPPHPLSVPSRADALRVGATRTLSSSTAFLAHSSTRWCACDKNARTNGVSHRSTSKLSRTCAHASAMSLPPPTPNTRRNREREGGTDRQIHRETERD
jgi:hypothetical protein